MRIIFTLTYTHITEIMLLNPTVKKCLSEKCYYNLRKCYKAIYLPHIKNMKDEKIVCIY